MVLHVCVFSLDASMVVSYFELPHCKLRAAVYKKSLLYFLILVVLWAYQFQGLEFFTGILAFPLVLVNYDLFTSRYQASSQKPLACDDRYQDLIVVFSCFWKLSIFGGVVFFKKFFHVGFLFFFSLFRVIRCFGLFLMLINFYVILNFKTLNFKSYHLIIEVFM